MSFSSFQSCIEFNSRGSLFHTMVHRGPFLVRVTRQAQPELAVARTFNLITFKIDSIDQETLHACTWLRNLLVPLVRVHRTRRFVGFRYRLRRQRKRLRWLLRIRGRWLAAHGSRVHHSAADGARGRGSRFLDAVRLLLQLVPGVSAHMSGKQEMKIV